MFFFLFKKQMISQKLYFFCFFSMTIDGLVPKDPRPMSRVSQWRKAYISPTLISITITILAANVKRKRNN